jgi:NitT/TauT family transport system permease protein
MTDAMLRARRAVLGVLGIVGAIVLWDVAVRLRWVDPLLLPTPLTVARRLWHNWTEPSFAASPLAKATEATLVHFTLGFALSVGIGVVAGAVIGMVRPVRVYTNTLLRLFQYTPPAAILPLLVLYLYQSATTVLTFIVVASVWPILIHTRDAIAGRDMILDAAARSAGWRGVRLFLRVNVHEIAAELGIGIRVASVVALLSTIFGEYFAGGTAGLGFEILLAKQAFRYADMYPAVITLAAIGFVVNAVFRYLETLATRWRTHGDSISAAPAAA